MVTSNEEGVQGSFEASPPASPPPEIEPENSILSEIESLNQTDTASEESPAPTQEEAPTSEAPATETPITQLPPPVAPPSPESSPPPAPQPAPQTPQYSPEQIQQLEQNQQEMQRLNQKAQIDNQRDQLKRHFENQGYDSDQASENAQYYVQSQQALQNVVEEGERQIRQAWGVVGAAEHFASQYKLSIQDLAVLRKEQTPQDMEAAAKRLSESRERDTELTKLRQAAVPPQQYDNSQGEPAAASGDKTWLQRYNQGDRSSEATSAARRAAGLG